MKSAIFYNSRDIFCNESTYAQRALIPGGELFASLFDIFNKNITLFDRTETIQVPIRCSLLPHMRMPLPGPSKSFEEICDARALELLGKAEASGRRIAAMYSGGVDSTLMLCSFLKLATPDQLKRVTVLMSNVSVAENPNFYYDHVIKNFECVPSHRFPYYLGHDDYLFMSGENADQLFGSQVTAAFAMYFGTDALFGPNNDGMQIDFIRRMLPENPQHAERLYRELATLVAGAPIPIKTVYQFWWWINFATKWQSVYMRVIPYSMNKATLKLEENYTTFYSPEEFQLWSMANADTIGMPDAPSKLVAKKYILDVNKDASYMTKPKIGSLANLVMRKPCPYTVDTDMNYSDEFSMDFVNPNNNFA